MFFLLPVGVEMRLMVVLKLGSEDVCDNVHS
jgi:hypothetical protein